MSLKITCSSLLEKQLLEVHGEGLDFRESSFVGGRKRFRFDEIECILMSPDHRLSFQARSKVFSIQTKAKSAKHRRVIDALLQEVRRSTQPAPRV